MTALAREQIQAAVAMYERDLAAEVGKLLAERGLLATSHHCEMMRSAPGMPDFVIVGRRRILWRELKSQNGALTEPQKYWATMLRYTRQDWAVWRPSDLLSGLIAGELDSIL
ncbi:MAG: hypothetical protein ACYCVZ_19385 [Streptosporangiaceae bacterium]